MKERWFFTMEGPNVVLRAQFEHDDGTVGDARDVLEPGEIFLGLSYDELKDAAPGSFTVKDGMAVIDHGATARAMSKYDKARIDWRPMK
jgi:hypothetical protein